MANLATTSITRAGVAISGAAASGGGDTFTPGNNTFVYLLNTSGGAHTVTVATPGFVSDDIAIADSVVSVGAGTERWIGPFPAEYFAQTTGLANITYSGVTNLSVGVFNLA